MLGGGPASQNPRLTPKQIRSALASHCHVDVIALSTDVCVLMRFLTKMPVMNARGGAIRGAAGVGAGKSRSLRHG
jgi:hypothetical protein